MGRRLALTAVALLLLANLAATGALAYKLREKEAALERVVGEARAARVRLDEVGATASRRIEEIEVRAAAAASTAAAFDEICAEMAAMRALAETAPAGLPTVRYDTAGRIVVTIAAACDRRAG